jgi:hypothetical protein
MSRPIDGNRAKPELPHLRLPLRWSMSHGGADCKAIAVVMLPDLYVSELRRNKEPIEMVGLFV